MDGGNDGIADERHGLEDGQQRFERAQDRSHKPVKNARHSCRPVETSRSVIEAGEARLPVLLASRPVVLVAFRAAWCAPCHAMLPGLAHLAREFHADGGRVAVASVDIDASPRAAAAHGVGTVPTVIVFVHGRPAHRFAGLASEESLHSAILDALREAAGTRRPASDSAPSAGA